MSYETLARHIEDTPELRTLAEANDVAGIVAAVNLKDRERTDNTLKTVAAIGDAFSLEDAETIVTIFKTASADNALLDSFYIRLSSVGVDFSHPKVQGMIDQIFTGDYAGYAAPLKAMGRWMESWADKHLSGVTVDQAFVEEALIVLARRDLERWVTGRYNAVLAAVQAGEVTDEVEAVELFAGEDE
jgi:hypothetical protein